MKKRAYKLRLHRETLRSLDGGTLSRVNGGETWPSECIGCYPTVFTECLSQCIVCPDTGGTSEPNC